MSSEKFWLMKTEPDVFSFDDLLSRPQRSEPWDGIRNYQARNFMRDEFTLGQQVFIYHSNAKPPGIAGIAEIVREAYPDPSALDPESKYFDEKSAKQGESRWCMVDVRATHKMQRYLTLDELRAEPGLDDMLLLKKGQRLSIQPVSQQHWDLICRLGQPKPV